MKKIFTLIIAATAALSASAQTQYGIYADVTTEAGSFQSVALSDDVWGYGIKGTGVTFTYGKDTKYLPTLIETLQCDPTKDFNSGAFIYDAYQVNGNYTNNWSISYANEVLFCSGYQNGTDKEAAGYISSDADAASRWPECTDPEHEKETKIDYGAKDLAAISDYWAGFEIEVPAGQTLNVSKISAAIGGGNNYAWSVQVYNEAGERLYDSKTAFIQSGNSTDDYKARLHIGYSADITATDVAEPLGGYVYLAGGDYDKLLPGGGLLPINLTKLDAFKTANGWELTSGKTPATLFQKLPEGGLKLTGKNTVRLYFGGIKNSRLFAIEHFYVEGEAVTDGISSVTAAPAAAARAYNLAGQAVGSDYKGVVIKGGKKVVQ